MFGVIEGPNYSSNDCVACNKVASNVGAIQESFVGIFASRVLWVDVQGLIDAPFWDQIGRLTLIYSFFYSSFININELFLYAPLVDFQNNLVSLFETGNFLKILRALFEYFTTDMIIAQTIPGKNCYQVGVAVGLIVR